MFYDEFWDRPDNSLDWIANIARYCEPIGGISALPRLLAIGRF